MANSDFPQQSSLFSDRLLDKIAGYNPEALSPVIILAYYDVSDFATLCNNYHNDLTARQYEGFNPIDASAHVVEVIKNNSPLTVYKEIRHLKDSNAPICFYHFLLDFRGNC